MRFARGALYCEVHGGGIAADNIDVQHAARNGIPEKRRSRENRFERVYTHLGAGKRTTAEKLAAV